MFFPGEHGGFAMRKCNIGQVWGDSVVKNCHSVVEKGMQRIKDKAVSTKWLLTSVRLTRFAIVILALV